MTEEGVHRDVYREGDKRRTERLSGPIPAIEAFQYAEDDFRENVERFVERSERWHDVRDGSSP